MPRDSRPTDALDGGRHDHLLVREFRLRVVEGPDSGLAFTASSPRAVIGTHQSTDFVLHDPTLSRFHCEIVLVDGKALVRDLGSRNGTLLEGLEIQAAPLHDKALLTLGRTKIRFGIGGRDVKVPLSRRERFGLMVGRSPAMRGVFAVLEQAAQSDATVLLQGETGTGKDLAAESIHMESGRREGPFVVVDSSALPPDLVESELFGHERGAFSGASEARPGAVESADGGTLFIDEIGELGAELQPKFLRLLENREVQRVGAAETRAPIFLANLERHHWPGNVRELRNYLERYLAVRDVEAPSATPTSDAPPPIDAGRSLREARRRWIAHFERRYVTTLLGRHDGNVSEAARAAGIARVNFYRLMTRAGLKPK